MNEKLQTIFAYHDRTKHAPNRYARSLGYMDWSTQPDPFRSYEGTRKIPLPLALDHTTPPYHLIFGQAPQAPLVVQSLSQLMQFSLGLAAWKSFQGNRWVLRCNASSGNLHPTEAYLVLPPLVTQQSSVCHYAPKEHQLEVLAEFDTDFWKELPENSFLIGLSSISWREVWKYGERAFRYCQLDAGHAWRALQVSAGMLGWSMTRLDGVTDSQIASLLGLGQSLRFFEDEQPDMLLLVSPIAWDSSLSIEDLLDDLPMRFEGIANRLSPQMHEWDIIPQIEAATFSEQVVQKGVQPRRIERLPSLESKEVVLKRRSAQMMNADNSRIGLEQFQMLMASVRESLDGRQSSVNLILFIHDVENLQPGLYIVIRNESRRQVLKELLDPDFLWKATDVEGLYLLKEGDCKAQAKMISCSQDIAADGAFSLGMLAEYSMQLHSFGPHRYKELYWECGAIGQQLYLEATALGLSATGIGCFLDDEMHALLGLEDNRHQVLYHFTVGRALVDGRLSTQPPYERND